MEKQKIEPVKYLNYHKNGFKAQYTCQLCGRNTFDFPIPHRCKGGFRKSGLTWKINYVNI